MASIVAIAASVSPAFAVGGDPAALVGKADPEVVDLIVAVRHGGDLLSEALPAVQVGDRVYAPIEGLASALEFPIRWSPAQASVSGWFIAAQRTFRLDLERRTVLSDGAVLAVAPGDILARDGELYVAIDAASRWLPVDFTFDAGALTINAAGRERLPLEARRARAAAREALEAARAAPAMVPVYPEIAAHVLSPSGQATTQALWTRRGEIVTALSAQGVVDLHGATASVYVSATGGAARPAARLRLYGEDPEGRALGGALAATRWELGDVAAIDAPLGWRGVRGLGFTLTNAPPQQTTEFDRLTLRGDVPDGYDVELYRNGLLIAARGEVRDGRYAFADVPLELGDNDLEIVLYGPQGQVERRRESLLIGADAIAPGEVRYALSVLAPEEASGVSTPRENVRGAMRIEAGVSRRTTLVAQGGIATDGAGATGLVGAGVRHSLGPFFARADIAGASVSSMAASAAVMGRWRMVSLQMSSAGYPRAASGDPRSIASGLSRIDEGTATIVLGRGARRTPLGLSVRRRITASGRTDVTYGVRTSGRFAETGLNAALETTSARAQGGAVAPMVSVASLDASRRIRGASVRVLAEGDIMGGGLQRLSVTADRGWTSGGARLGVVFDPRARQVMPTASLAQRLWGGELALEAAADAQGRLSMLGVSWRMGLAGPAFGRGFAATSAAPDAAGQVFARVFEDRDADGRFGPGDVALEGVRVHRGGGYDALTDRDGMARFPSVPTDARAAVSLDVGSLPDPFLTPVRPGYAVLARPGAAALAEFPVVATAEVEGVVYLVVDGRRTPLEGVEVLVHPVAGGPVRRVRTEFDGLFALDGALPGRYRASLAPDIAARLGVTAPVVEFVVDAPGAMVRAPPLVAQRPAPPSQTDLAARRDDPSG